MYQDHISWNVSVGRSTQQHRIQFYPIITEANVAVASYPWIFFSPTSPSKRESVYGYTAEEDTRLKNKPSTLVLYTQAWYLKNPHPVKEDIIHFISYDK